MNGSEKILHIYLADHDWGKTSSKGIYHFSQNFLRELAARNLEGFRVLVSVRVSDAHRLIPEPLPDWLEVISVSGPRMWLDQVWAPWFNWRNKVDVVFYVKGVVPFLKLGKEKIQAVFYDTILEHYRVVHPDFFPKVKVGYFLMAKSHALKKADANFTISEFSKQELLSLYQPKSFFTVLPLGNSLIEEANSVEKREGFLVFLSNFPHKCSSEALQMLVKWKTGTGSQEPIYAVGRGELPDALRAEIVCEGRLTDEELGRRIRSVKAVILLSEIEGFGLPILEAYSRGTPVVYRNKHAYAEVLREVEKGRWDGETCESFFDAVEEVLDMSGVEIQGFAEKLLQQYNWQNCVNMYLSSLYKVWEEN